MATKTLAQATAEAAAAKAAQDRQIAAEVAAAKAQKAQAQASATAAQQALKALPTATSQQQLDTLVRQIQAAGLPVPKDVLSQAQASVATAVKATQAQTTAQNQLTQQQQAAKELATQQAVAAQSQAANAAAQAKAAGVTPTVPATDARAAEIQANQAAAARVAADAAAYQKAQQDAAAKAAADRAVAVKAYQDAQAKAQADQLAQQQATAKAQADRLAAVKSAPFEAELATAKTQAQIDDIMARAKTAGATVNPGAVDRANQIVQQQAAQQQKIADQQTAQAQQQADIAAQQKANEQATAQKVAAQQADTAQRQAEINQLRASQQPIAPTATNPADFEKSLPSPQDFIKSGASMLRGPDGSEYSLTPANQATGQGPQWIKQNPNTLAVTNLGTGQTVSNADYNKQVQAIQNANNDVNLAQRAQLISDQQQANQGITMDMFGKLLAVAAIGSVLAPMLAGAGSASEVAGAASSLAEGGASADEIAATLQASGVPAEAATTAANTATGVANGTINAQELAAANGITPESVTTAANSANPLATVNETIANTATTAPAGGAVAPTEVATAAPVAPTSVSPATLDVSNISQEQLNQALSQNNPYLESGQGTNVAGAYTPAQEAQYNQLIGQGKTPLEATNIVEGAAPAGPVTPVDITGAAGTAEAPSYAVTQSMTPGSQLATQAQIQSGAATWNPAANAWEVPTTTLPEVVVTAPAMPTGLTSGQLAGIAGAGAVAAGGLGGGGGGGAATAPVVVSGTPTAVAPTTTPATTTNPAVSNQPPAVTTTPPVQPPLTPPEQVVIPPSQPITPVEATTPLTPPETTVIPPGTSTVTPVQAPAYTDPTGAPVDTSGFTAAQIAKMAAAGLLVAKVLTPPATPGGYTYGPIKPLDWGKTGTVTTPGLNPGFITNVPGQYNTTNMQQSRFYWGQHPYQTGTVFNPDLYRSVPAAPAVPFGLQQMYTPQAETIPNLLQGVAQASATAPYNIPQAPKV